MEAQKVEGCKVVGLLQVLASVVEDVGTVYLGVHIVVHKILIDVDIS